MFGPIGNTSSSGPTGTSFGQPTNTSIFNVPTSTTSGVLFRTPTSKSPFVQPASLRSSCNGFSDINTNFFSNPFGIPTRTSSSSQPQQSIQQTAPFDPPNIFTNAGLFGPSTGFAITNTTPSMTGTVVKFCPVTGTDFVTKNGSTWTISTRHHCITSMKEYEAKSLEELRMEDYTAGRKGPQTQTTGIFSVPVQTSFFQPVTSNSNVFNTTNQPGESSIFKKPIQGFISPKTTNAFTFKSTTSSNPFFINTTPFAVAATAPSFSTNSTAPTTVISSFNQNKPAFDLPATSSTSAAFNPFLKPNTPLFNNFFNPAVQTTDFSLKTSATTSSTGTHSCFNTGTSTGFRTTTSTLPSLGINMQSGVGTNQIQQNNVSVPVHQQIFALAPFGDSPLLKNLVPTSSKSEELMKSMKQLNSSINSIQYKISTIHSKIKPRLVTPSDLSKKISFENFEDNDPSLIEAFQPRPNAKRLVLRPKSVTSISNPVEKCNSLINETSRDNETPADDSTSSIGFLKLSTPKKILPESVFDDQQSLFSYCHTVILDHTVAELRPSTTNKNSFALNTSLSADEDSSDSIEQGSYSTQELKNSLPTFLQSENIAKLAKVTLRRIGYYTIPSLEKLDDYVCGETCVVPNFTVGRKGYGNVYFPDSIDVYGMNLDKIFHLRNKEVIIYPENDEKPPLGQGLNRRAQVTLDRVWPQDKSRYEPITDPHRLEEMNFEEKLRKLSAKYHTRFIEYRVETGSWVFMVNHF